MATYTCDKCDMSVDISCAKCNKPLSDDVLHLENGQDIQIAICDECKGKVKSPQCCGEDMVCQV
ncbi:MAG: hypothetical protein OXC03_05240 [Flavobacteriaceae bacterium]|nr:hypothetical protein [Flavobacteriaceae bacterium]